MFCPNCGKEIKNGNFCTSCGYKINSSIDKKEPSFFRKHKLKILLFSLLAVFIVAGAIVGNKVYIHYQMSQIRTFYGVEIINDERSDDNGTYITFEQDGYGKIYKSKVYQDNKLVSKTEREYDKKGHLKKMIRYNSDGEINFRALYKTDDDGKLIKRDIYDINGELLRTDKFLEGDTKKNREKAKDNKEYIIVEYDKYGREVLWKNYYEDGTSTTYKYKYNKYGLVREIGYDEDNEEFYRLELKLDE